MSKSSLPQLPIGMIQSVDDWIKHFIDMHTQMPGTPSPDEIRKYPQVLVRMIADHDELHMRFYTGHEHKTSITPFRTKVSMIVPGRTK